MIYLKIALIFHIASYYIKRFISSVNNFGFSRNISDFFLPWGVVCLMIRFFVTSFFRMTVTERMCSFYQFLSVWSIDKPVNIIFICF